MTSNKVHLNLVKLTYDIFKNYISYAIKQYEKNHML